jgi:PPOX class probable F420-dependent enzyme
LDKIKSFDRHKYISVETYRKNGQGVRTPVWFVTHEGELCFTTEGTSGKVKRLRHNPRVMVAPCTVNGDLLGEWIMARARILNVDEIAAVKKVYARKYGVMKLLFGLMGLFRKSERLYIALTLD